MVSFRLIPSFEYEIDVGLRNEVRAVDLSHPLGVAMTIFGHSSGNAGGPRIVMLAVLFASGSHLLLRKTLNAEN